MAKIIFSIPYPPSVNAMWRTIRGRPILSAHGRSYRIAVVHELLVRKISMLDGRLSMCIRMFPPDKRRRDVDNVAKGVLDALQHAKVYRDDNQIDKLCIERCPPDPHHPRVEITLDEIK